MSQGWAIVRTHASGLVRTGRRALLDGGTVKQAHGKRQPVRLTPFDAYSNVF